MNVGQQCALVTKAADGVLGCTGQSVAGSSREVTLPPCSALVRPQWCAQVRAPRYKTGGHTGESPTKVYEDDEGPGLVHILNTIELGKIMKKHLF